MLGRISSGVLAEDRRAAVTELQSLVAESPSAQLAVGAMGCTSFVSFEENFKHVHCRLKNTCYMLLHVETGFPVLLSVLKEERDDVEIIRAALETLVSALSPIDTAHGQKNEIQPASINSDLLSRESESISLLLSLLVSLSLSLSYLSFEDLLDCC